MRQTAQYNLVVCNGKGEQGGGGRKRKDCRSLVKNQVWKIMM